MINNLSSYPSPVGLEGLTDAEVTSLEREQKEYMDLALMYGYKEAYSKFVSSTPV